MRIVIVGASHLAVRTAAMLIEENHAVIIIDRNRDKLNDVAGHLDCGLIHGDGSRPEILKEASPEASDCLLCLTDSDQDNIITSLVGRSLGFPDVITKIEDEAFERICQEIGLKNTIVPSRDVAGRLATIVTGRK
ncbi:potassium channel family protein [Microvirga roseola]|uniref:potassium channel family protein n=1 Tax=Microvirga roseola TaxID=2883126 RepID=UPI001E631CE8|nr:NAD-binding protein [Microvirga roseola]